jgi:phosphocarrier protein FPr
VAGLVGIVVVAHSRALADAAVALAGEMLAEGSRPPIEVAAGLDEHTFGTDAAAIEAAISAADDASQGAGVVVLMDLGSAVLSAELATELLDDEVRERAVLCPAPLVEGLIVAAVTAAGGAPRADVAAEAAGALAGKLAQLAPPDHTAAPDDPRPAASHGTPPAAADDSNVALLTPDATNATLLTPDATNATLLTPDATNATFVSAAAPAEGTGSALVGSFTVINPHGLHARPAATLAAAANRFDATVRVRNRSTGSDWVPAASFSRLGTLGALAGHRLEISADGPAARTALDQLLGLAERGFDEPPPTTPLTAPPLQPLGAVPGLALGPARHAPKPTPAPFDQGEGALTSVSARTEPRAEWHRLTDARRAAGEHIARTRELTAERIGDTEAGIFDAHLAMLDDPELLAAARTGIDAGQPAEPAWTHALDEAGAALAALPDEYLRARAADLQSVRDQVLLALAGGPTEAPSPDGVLLAADLTPAQAAGLDPARVAAVVLAQGSATAHSVILLRALGIPTIVAAGPTVLEIADGTPLAVDAENAELIVDPAPEVQRRYTERIAERADRDTAARGLAGQPAFTADGTRILVGANLGSVRDAEAAREAGAELAGLVRTEFLFLGRTSAPDAGEQEASYRRIAAALPGRRITLRTLDVGGDKPLSYLPMPAEANPFLGLRGLRLSLARPELLAEQLTAAVRVARDVPVDLMFPMVSTRAELVAARAMLDDVLARQPGGRPAGLRVGIMVEVPSAALNAATLAPLVDFFSIGTNDLTQYTLAAERGNAAVAGLADPLDPSVLRLIQVVCATGRPVGVCGELAADPAATPILLGLGVRELSMAPSAISRVKQEVRAIPLPAAEALARAALTSDSAAAVRALIRPAR